MTMKKILLFSLFSFLYAVSNAATYYWVGLSAAGLWSDASNWSATSGGTGGAGVPMFSNDVAKLDKTAVIDINSGVSISSINVSANVGFKPSSGALINVNIFTIDAGSTFTLNAIGGGGTTLTVGTISVSGTFDFSTTNSTSDLTITGSLFGGIIKRTDMGTRSKIRFTGSSSQSFSANLDPSSIIDVIVNNGNAGLNLSSNISIPGSLTLTGSKLTVNTYNLTVKDKISGNGALGNYVILNNPIGSVTLKNIGDNREIAVSPFFVEGGKSFHIGVSATSYDGLYIYNDQGTDVLADFTVKLADKVPTGASNPLKVFKREWDISTSSTRANVEFQPSTSSAPVLGFMPTPPVIGHYVGSTWTEKPSTPDVNLGAGLPYGAKFTSFSPFGVGQASGFLPVELLSFKANQKNNTNLLTWQTASEKNNSHFDIERSTTGQEDWVTLGTVKGNGNSQIMHDYTFNDNTPLSISYYRLKQVDNDGRFEYSNVVSVTTKGGKFKVNALSPNPTKDNLTIQFESNKNDVVSVSVMDMTGRVVFTQNASATEGGNLLNVNTASLSNGIYMVSLKNSESVILNKIVKQ
jgi:DNA uptake protein ComE-like DNA-binding protein